MTLKYEIKFLDYWHLGSGLSAGAKLDSTVTKDDEGIAYASGKTIKGLAREMAEEFGDIEFLHQCYFENATLDKTTHEEIETNNLQNNLYDVIAFTKIEDGIAVDDSLREIEVVIPITLVGEILDIPSKDDCDKLLKSLKMIKRMGLNRNRGLGRCEFKEIECKS